MPSNKGPYLKTCTVERCAKPMRVRNMCEAHYRRFKKYGDPLYMHKKACHECGGDFSAWTANAKYCSGACHEMARMRRAGLTCADCREPMPKTRTSAPQGKARCLDCRNGGRGYYKYGNGQYASHGESGYRRGCRCNTCSASKADKMAQYFADYKTEHGVSWSAANRRKFREEHGYWPQGSGFDFVTQEVRLAIYERDGWTCQLCGTPVHADAPTPQERPTLDHIVPQSQGGPHTPHNHPLAHGLCNAMRGAGRDVSKDKLAARIAAARNASALDSVDASNRLALTA